MSAIPSIRLCTIEDLDRVYEIGLGFFKEGALPGKLVKEVFVNSWTTFITGGMGGILALERENKIIGCLGFLVYPDPNDGEKVTSETFWYVEPESRGYGLLLLNKFEQLSKQLGVKRIMMAHMLNLMPEEIAHLYIRKGYRPLETNYIKEIQP